MSALGKLLYARLVETTAGDLIRYDELSAIIVRDVQEEGRGYLAEARLLALRNDRAVFDVERDVGIRRADNQTIVSLSEGRVEGIERAAKRGGDILAVVDVDALDEHDRTRARVAHTQLGILRLFAAPQTTKRLAGAAEGGRSLLPPKAVISRTLKMFEDST